MAQLNISFFTDMGPSDKRKFATTARNVAAKEVHGLTESEIMPDSVSVLVVPLDTAVSISGADIEVQLLVSGNNWPTDQQGQPVGPVAAKTHFDALAAKMHHALSGATEQKVYVWVTPYMASGWAA